MGILILAEETIHENTKCVMDITIYIMQHKDTTTISVKTPQWKKGWHEIDDFTLKWSKLCLITIRRFMHVYVLCQMDHRSPVFPEMDYPLWIKNCSKFTWV